MWRFIKIVWDIFEIMEKFPKLEKLWFSPNMSLNLMVSNVFNVRNRLSFRQSSFQFLQKTPENHSSFAKKLFNNRIFAMILQTFFDRVKVNS